MAANNAEMANEGEFTVPFRSGNTQRKSSLQNLPGVGMPIFSRNQIAREKHRIILEDDDGTIIHKPSGDMYHFIAALGGLLH